MTVVSEEYEECLTVIESVIAQGGYRMLIIAGDLNTDLARPTAQTNALIDFMARNSLRSTWTLRADYALSTRHTFISCNGHKLITF